MAEPIYLTDAMRQRYAKTTSAKTNTSISHIWEEQALLTKNALLFWVEYVEGLRSYHAKILNAALSALLTSARNEEEG